MYRIESRGAVLLCGGKGLRFSEITEGIKPKPLVNLGGKPLIQHSIDNLPYPIFSHLVFAVGHQSDQLIQWANSQNLYQQAIFSFQKHPGILDAVKCGLGAVPVDQDNAVCNTDEVRKGLQITDIIEFHHNSQTLATLIATHSDKLYRHGCLTIREKDSLVTSFQLKPEEYRLKPETIGLVFTGMMLIDKMAIDYFDITHSSDWMGIIDPLLDAYKLSAFVVPGLAYFNVGTPEEYREAEMFFDNYTERRMLPEVA